MAEVDEPTEAAQRAFSGRVVFDHLHKTAGQAVNAWLASELGNGCITTNLIGDHRDLIRRYGGQYSIISAHVYFRHAELLDSRYQYMTLLREPVDRAISWIYYLANDVGVTRETTPLKEGASRFIASGGTDGSPEFLESIRNPYTEHFCRIFGNGSEPDDEKLANALAAIREYDVVGVYEEMPDFLANVAALLGIPPPRDIAPVNVTTRRARIDQISPRLRECIIALNELDLRLYTQVLARKHEGALKCATRPALCSVSKWKKYEAVQNHRLAERDLCIRTATVREGFEIRRGQLMTLDVDFSLKRQVSELEMGIHIFDNDGRWAFGTNSTLLGRTYRLLPSGTYRVSHHLIADLPTGKYTAGFAFSERLPGGGQTELAWRDVMCEFRISQQVSRTFAGYAYVPAEITLRPTSVSYVADEERTVWRFAGSDSRLRTHAGVRVGSEIVSTGSAGHLVFGPYISLSAGHYRLTIHGSLGVGGLAGARMNIANDKGSRVVAEHELREPDGAGRFVDQLFELDTACTDLEVRVWVDIGSDLRISLIVIEPCALSDLSGQVDNTVRHLA
ncbi:Wzt carbohydrate-binding domain-containing protein [Paraburkholderia hospita]|uniref:Wzt carbohydrate-binding domain-containing protein n=1 Tax=Paraburkholderia hospita TaxID=169430 RepID=UPI0002718B20|nr:Wzt carbohydrate-binding domain-containing protein [Paraburkholderia hospita]EUC14745.1 Chondroitin 4-O-sulfotransferase [Burkholderia sp. BT03]SKC94001.1 Sulfotransferase family protein [Paraburkholderia hospita]